MSHRWKDNWAIPKIVSSSCGAGAGIFVSLRLSSLWENLVGKDSFSIIVYILIISPIFILLFVLFANLVARSIVEE